MTQAFNLSQFANFVNSSGKADLTTAVTGTLPVANGGSGAATFSSGSVLLGSGTSSFGTVAPSTAGNVLTSNGSSWISTTATGLGISQVWTNVTSSIVNNTTYTNNTGKPIAFVFSLIADPIAGSAGIDFYVDGGIITSIYSYVCNISGSDTVTSTGSGFAIVQNTKTYKFVFTNVGGGVKTIFKLS